MVHCFQNIWFNKRTHHPNEYRKGHRLWTKWVLASDQSSVRSWPMQPKRCCHLQQGSVPEGAVH